MFLLLIPPILFVTVGIVMTLGFISAKLMVKDNYDILSGAWIAFSIIYFLLLVICL